MQLSAGGAGVLCRKYGIIWAFMFGSWFVSLSGFDVFGRVIFRVCYVDSEIKEIKGIIKEKSTESSCKKELLQQYGVSA